MAIVLGPAASAQDGEVDPARERMLTATLGVEWATGTGDGDAQKLELRLEPELRLDLPHRFQLGAIARIRADAMDELEPGPPDQPEVAPYTRRLGFGDRADAELRELYVQGEIGPAWLRVGKQQIVWGQADGLKVLDVVNPQEFHEFILPAFEDSRIPLWTVNTEIPIGDAQLQLLWIPDPTTHDVPPADGVFAFRAPRFVGPRPPRGIDVEIEEPDRPDDALRDSDVGARLAGFWKGWDLSANALWHHDDVPIPFRTIDVASGAPRVRVEPGFERSAVLGGTASSAFGNLTVRGEFAAQLDRWVPVDDLGDRDGVRRTSEFGWVVGLDWWGIPETLLSVQLFQTWLTDHRPSMLRDRLDSDVTLLARRHFRNETLTLEAIWIHGLHDGDGLVRPRVEYAVHDDLQVWLGFDVFYGTRDGVFGEFDEADRVVVGFEWGL
ncbi:MAG: hypothetical protein DCC71_07285 [Proteobacteria bacterium]|nr:MAG: hypothetical protein DCC71_07285 [Pseudomonadota bacterium]